ncbi:hypothetical protein RJG79_02485 [Mycoplasmatota bacterium WC44]
MKCLKCGELINNIDRCHNCLINQEEYLFDNLDILSLKDILSFIFKSGIFSNNLTAIKAAFNDLLINFEAEKNVLGLILSEQLLNNINNLSSLEDTSRFVNIETRKQVNKYGTNEALVSRLLKVLIESIKPEYVKTAKTKTDNNKIENSKKNDIRKEDNQKHQKSPVKKKAIIGIVSILIIMISSAIYFNLDKISSNLKEEPLQTITEDFSILYTNDNVNFTTFNMSEMDSFYEDGIWYVWYKDLGDVMYKYIIGNGFSSGGDEITLKFGTVRIIMSLAGNGDSYIQLTSELSVPFRYNVKIRNDKIYLPIEKILKMLHYPEYSEDGKQMIVRSSLDTEMIERYSSNETEQITYNEEKDSKDEFTIIYTYDYVNYQNHPISSMDSFYENETWYVWYEELNDGIGTFTKVGNELIFSNGTGAVVMDVTFSNEPIIRVFNDNTSNTLEYTLGANIIERSGKIYVPIELMLSRLNKAEYTSDGKQMNVEYIRNKQDLITKLSPNVEN